jgi:hypothetical protein
MTDNLARVIPLETTTQSDTPAGVPAPEESAEREARREARARAREATTPAGETESDGEERVGVGVPVQGEPDRPGLVARIRRAWTPVEHGGSGLWRPPELWDTPREPLRDIAAYLRSAPWTTDRGWVRALGVAYIPVGVALVGAGYLVAWVCQRPARLVVVSVLVLIARLALTATQ